MPLFRKLTAAPYPLMLIGFVLAGLILLDSAQKPSEQITVKVLVAGIRVYQRTCLPLVSRFVRCRYRPTCSYYCALALQRHGIGRGSLLCVRRLLSCTRSVPPGTPDPVPHSSSTMSP
jgi:putative membrane protein insertion efficiency factor